MMMVIRRLLPVLGLMAALLPGAIPATETMAKMKTVTTNGANLSTESFGQPERGTILLVMGATASMMWWPDSLCLRLAEGGYRVIRFDLRDTGQSTASPPGAPGYTVADLADDLLAILDAYDVASAHFVGMSLGGYLSQIVALEHPGRVMSLTLIASEPYGQAYEGEGISQDLLAHFGKLAALNWTDRAAVAAFMLRGAELSAGSVPGFDAEDAADRIGRELDRAASMPSAFNHTMMAGGDLPAGTIADVALPVLVIHGSEDPVISPEAGRTIARLVPRSDLLLLEGRGHELAPADLGTIAEAILAHLEAAPR
jgi:pimeloyl-ACP methyl ester carboxylesterase